jgi:hypothetical protein
MTIPTLTADWSAAVTITRDTYFECRAGIVLVAYGATPLAAPANLQDGIQLQQGDALTLKGGQDFRLRSPSPTNSVLFYGEQGA